MVLLLAASPATDPLWARSGGRAAFYVPFVWSDRTRDCDLGILNRESPESSRGLRGAMRPIRTSKAGTIVSSLPAASSSLI
jgi:hypothetical protein